MNELLFSEKAQDLTKPLSKGLEAFSSIARFFARFHVLSFAFLSLQLFSLPFFLTHWSQFAGFTIALLFLSFFAYLILAAFFRSWREEQLQALQLQGISFQDTLELLFATQNQEMHLYQSHYLGLALARAEGKAKNWLYWKSFFRMKELLLQSGLRQVLLQVMEEPLKPSHHEELAILYTELCLLYTPNTSTFLWISKEYSQEPIKTRFMEASARAMEEWNIVEFFQGTSLQTQKKKAELFCLQGNRKGEITQYETLLQQTPHDLAAQVRLGILYFLEGRQAEGLSLYEKLRANHKKEAKELLEHYDKAF